MNDDKAVVITRPHRPDLGADERARVLARWTKGGLGAEEVARQAGVSRSSLGRWKRALGPTAQTVTPSPALVEVPAPVSQGAVAEVPAPVSQGAVAEVMTNGGAVRLFAAAAPAWAAQLVRELNRC